MSDSAEPSDTSEPKPAPGSVAWFATWALLPARPRRRRVVSRHHVQAARAIRRIRLPDNDPIAEIDRIVLLGAAAAGNVETLRATAAAAGPSWTHFAASVALRQLRSHARPPVARRAPRPAARYGHRYGRSPRPSRSRERARPADDPDPLARPDPGPDGPPTLVVRLPLEGRLEVRYEGPPGDRRLDDWLRTSRALLELAHFALGLRDALTRQETTE